ncbi:hypothetical protein J4573_37415 [Actinomadura barringtoniae]|uniref:Protein kinase domain-containing protein n=1 Tax=Actinomadura barringtoniae TaxID=1427535 RepID=A0A939PQF0_9ACTN|nr:hypothetical protein [Actinomadura barringtoniae]MBO2452821.1 hypothetical protein [Actinomadura barringtoniae]
MAEPRSDSDPLQISEYTVLRRLGAGGMGVVCQCRSPAGRLVAVKVIRAGLVEEPGPGSGSGKR